MGVMINALFGDGGKASKAMQHCLGKQFSEVKLEDNNLIFAFDDGKLRVFDDGQSCCENRYMVTDDDLPYFAEAILIELTVEDGPELVGEYDESHDQQFLHVKTSKGSFTMSNHNEHNGYYGGFSIAARFDAKEEDDGTGQ
jgi:hypothetical protein